MASLQLQQNGGIHYKMQMQDHTGTHNAITYAKNDVSLETTLSFSFPVALYAAAVCAICDCMTENCEAVNAPESAVTIVPSILLWLRAYWT